MSRLFDDAIPHYLQIDSGIITAAPLTMACWFYCDDATINQTLMILANSAATVARDCFRMMAVGAVISDPVRAHTGDSVGVDTVDSTTGFSINTWAHACAVFASATSRSAYINGGSKATDTASRTPAGINRFTIGQDRQATANTPYSGRIAEAGLWDVALTDDEVATLADGVSPLMVRPANLVGYWPLFGYASPELDVMSTNTLTVTGATKDDHPRVIMPGRSRLILPAAVVAATPKNLLLLGAGV